MTLFEVAIVGPFYCFLVAVIGQALLQISAASDHPWAGKIAIGIALVAATGITWGVSNMSSMDDAPPFAAYAETTDWRGYKY